MYEIKHKYFDMKYKDMETYVNMQIEEEKTHGCTRSTKLSKINFMLYSKATTVILKSMDASNSIKDHKYINGLSKFVINLIIDVSQTNVV